MKEQRKNHKHEGVSAIPEGFHTVTPFLIVDEASKLIAFLKKAFDGKLTYLLNSEDGRVMHSTVRIGDSEVMITDSMEQYPAGMAKLYVYVEDVDATYKQAKAAGGISLREPTDEFYGDRSAGIKDAWGNEWWIATHIEDVGPEEMKRRQQEFTSKQAVAS